MYEADLGGATVSTWSFGSIPGNEIRLAKGERLRVDLSNDLPAPTTVHWHGLAIRNDMDGVPDLTQSAVASRGRFRYEFTVPESGTFWFHPHVGTQLDRGLYAPLIVEDPADGADYDEELVVVLDDWLDGTGRTPDGVLAGLRRNGMGGMGGMGGGTTGRMAGTSMPSSPSSPSMSSMPGMSGMSGGAMSSQTPSPAGSTNRSGMRMARSRLLRGDAGDVSYPYYLANGRISAAPQTVRAVRGRRYRLRLINAAADTAFRIGLPGVRMRLTHTDGFPITPVSADAVLLGMGERIDAIVEIPDQSVPLLAVAEGKNGLAQVVFRVGNSRPSGSSAALLQLGNASVRMSIDTHAIDAVALTPRPPDVTHVLTLGGPGPKYRWTINGQTYDPTRGVPVRTGQRVRLRFVNDTTMFHPMHLHGHTFEVRAARSGGGPRKDTVLVLPHSSVEVDFDADNPGQWLTHCHNVYHGEAGMMTVVSYVR